MKATSSMSIREPRLALSMLLLALLALLPPSAHAIGTEYRIKAAFLLNFTRYIEWPRKSGELNICVIGPDVFGSALDDLVAGKVVNGRKLLVRKSASPLQAMSCDMAYISLSESRKIREALSALETSPVFTVGEDADFLRMGGMLAFAPMDGKVRFYINAVAAERAGISISSRLMVLGINLRDQGERRR